MHKSFSSPHQSCDYLQNWSIYVHSHHFWLQYRCKKCWGIMDQDFFISSTNDVIVSSLEIYTALKSNTVNTVSLIQAKVNTSQRLRQTSPWLQRDVAVVRDNLHRLESISMSKYSPLKCGCGCYQHQNKINWRQTTETFPPLQLDPRQYHVCRVKRTHNLKKEIKQSRFSILLSFS